MRPKSLVVKEPIPHQNEQREVISEKALKRIDRLAGKFEGPNAGFVWGVWPLWFVGVDHPFHIAGVKHDLEYLLKEAPLWELVAAIEALPSHVSQPILAVLSTMGYRIGIDGYSTKTRDDVDSELLRDMLEIANTPELRRLAFVGYYAVRGIGWRYWYF